MSVASFTCTLVKITSSKHAKMHSERCPVNASGLNQMPLSC